MQLPQVSSSITIGGRQSKVIVADYPFGNSNLLYSTAQVLFAGRIGDRDVLLLYGDSDQVHEASLVLVGTSTTPENVPGITSTSASHNQTIFSFSGVEGFFTVYKSQQQLILYADSETATTFWNPVIPASAKADFTNYWQLGSNSSVLVGGPYLVRNATISGKTLALTGDLDVSVKLFVVAPDTVSTITWNGEPVAADDTLSSDMLYVGQLQTKEHTLLFTPPTLNSWKYSDSLPELNANFSDLSWAIANHTRTNIPFPPYYGDKVLYGCDYELCVLSSFVRLFLTRRLAVKTLFCGAVTSMLRETRSLSICRSTADRVSASIFFCPMSSICLSYTGFAASVWLNDVFLNTSYGK